MNEPLERLLNDVTPRGAPADLRDRTLAVARDTLAARPPRRWDLWCSVGVAAALLLGIGLNCWVLRIDEARLAELYGPEPLPKYLAEAADSIEAVTNPETGQWVRRQWRTAQAARRQSRDEAVDRIRHHYQSIVDEFAVARKEPPYVEKNHQVGRDRLRRSRGDTSYHFRHTYLRHQLTA